MIKQLKDANLGVTFSSESLTESENKGARILQALAAMRQVTLSPYTWECKRKAITPTYLQYVESSPKLMYVIGCIKSVIDYHYRKGQKPSGQVMYMNAGTQFFVLIKEYFVKKLGLKDSQVGLITGSMSKNAKENVKKQFLNGDLLVLIGSSSISVGVDLQDNASALFNCYYDWNPTDSQQVEGRIWRQGNRFNNVRIVYPMLYNSVDPVMFQYLHEKTERINEIWNVDGETSELDLRDFDPKKLQKELITDPEEKADWDILEETEKVETNIIYYENRLDSIRTAMQAITQMKEQEPQVFEYINSLAAQRAKTKKEDAISLYKEKRTALMDEFDDDEEKLASEVAKLKKKSYDIEGDPVGKYNANIIANEDKEGLYAEAKKVAEWLTKLSYSDIGGKVDETTYYNRGVKINLLKSYRNNYKDFSTLKERILVPLGIDVKNIEEPVAIVTQKIEEFKAELSGIENSRAEKVQKYKKEFQDLRTNQVSVKSRVAEFTKGNPILDELMQLSKPKIKAVQMQEKAKDEVVESEVQRQRAKAVAIAQEQEIELLELELEL